MSTVGAPERNQVRTWGALRSAGIDLIERHGYDGVTVEAIADAAGVSKRTFFNYFASKDAVIFDPAPNERALWDELAAERPVDEPMWTSLEAFFLGYSRAHRDHLARQRRVIASSPTLTRLGWAAAEQYEAFLTEWMLTRLPRSPGAGIQARAIANAAIAALSVAFFAWSPTAGVDALDDLIEESFHAVSAAQAVSAPCQPSGGASNGSHR